MNKLTRTWSILVAVVVAAVAVWVSRPVQAAGPLGNRSLLLGSSFPAAATTHTFAFSTSVPGPAPLGSISFSYCMSPLEQDPCLPGNGAADVDLTAAGQPTAMTGVTDWSMSVSGPNSFYITHTPVALPGGTAMSFTIPAVANPTGTNQTFFVRIQTYEAADLTIPADYGAVAGATVQEFSVEATVPPYLEFCVGVTIGSTCASATGSQLDFGEFSSDVTRSATTQFMAQTNAPFGYVVVPTGSTLAAGTHTISALAAQTPAVPGVGQFGLNLRANAQPAIGADPSGGGAANVAPAYGVANQYRYQAGDVLASSPNETDYNKFTVSYIVNIPSTQPTGIYTTTMTFICTATF